MLGEKIRYRVSAASYALLCLFVAFAFWNAYRSRHEASVTRAIDSSLNYTGSGILVVDYNDTITEWSKSAEVLTGWAREEVIGKELTLLIPEWMREKHEAGFKVAAAARVNRVKYFVCSMILKDGSEAKVAVVVRPYQDGFVGIIDRR